MSYLNPIFPGMDPFIEDQVWREFHTLMMSQIRLTLNNHLASSYYAAVRKYDYGTIDRHEQAPTQPIKPPNGDTPTSITPSTRRYRPLLYDIWEPNHVEIRSDRGELVTLIEMLTPDDKVGGVDRPYLRRRQHFLLNQVNFVEIDLLRGGQRTEGGMPNEGYNVFVIKIEADGEPHGYVYEIGLRDKLPVIPIPLHPQVEDMPLELDSVFRKVFIQARYAINVDHTRKIHTPMSKEDADWVEQTLSAVTFHKPNGAKHDST